MELIGTFIFIAGIISSIYVLFLMFAYLLNFQIFMAIGCFILLLAIIGVGIRIMTFFSDAQTRSENKKIAKKQKEKIENQKKFNRLKENYRAWGSTGSLPIDDVIKYSNKEDE